MIYNMWRKENMPLALEGIHVPEAALQVGESSENIWRTQLARSDGMVKLGFTSVLDMKIK